MTDNHATTTLEGIIDRITYHNVDNHFVIAKFRTGQSKAVVSILGYLPDPKVGEQMILSGRWENHARYGQQFRIDAYETIMPVSIQGIQQYLGSGLIKGIGPAMASRLTDRFGEKTIDVIEKTPDLLTEIKGIGQETAGKISESWHRHHAMRDLMQFLGKCSINPSYAAKIFKAYKTDALHVLKNEPAKLIQDLPGIGFYIADAIARNSDAIFDEVERNKACILHLLQKASEDGHVYVDESQLIQQSRKYFDMDEISTGEAIATLAGHGSVMVDDDISLFSEARAVYLAPLHTAEVSVCLKLSAMLSIPVSRPSLSEDAIAETIFNRMAIALSSEQSDVLGKMLSHRVAIITGGPGTGKTTLIRSIATVFDTIGKRILLAAPTGRAARCLSEVTGKPASTIHKLLGYNPTTGSFDKNQDNPLDSDAVIVDEASMIDIVLMKNLLNAVPLNARILFVGDLFQLPSVGPGSVLSDLISSNKIMTFELTEIFRQARKSQIITSAHHVRNGGLPLINQASSWNDSTEFIFMEENNPRRAMEKILNLYCHEIPARLGFDPFNEIQVLSPMHKGNVGTINLNRLLQKEINTAHDAIEVFGRRFKNGDKVMHLKNNYEKEVFNGDIGVIHAIDKREERLDVDYEGRLVAYAFSDLDELTHAYAISIHKSQGSEYPAVIIPIMTQHFALLQRNLLYTAITRARRLVVLIGSKKAIHIALKTDKPQMRMSGLGKRLMEI